MSMSMLIFEASSPQQLGKKRSLKVFFGIGTIAVVTALGSTFASNINLNGNQNVEFGQGVVQSTACDDSVTITPTSGFSNAQGAFILSSIEVSGINSDSSHCMNKSFTIRVYDESSQTALDIFDEVSYVRVNDDGSQFLMSSSSGVTLNQTSGDSSRFTLQFDPTHSPVASNNVYKITIQSGDYQPVNYSLGDVGPDGAGIIYAVVTAGFACGATKSQTCHYLEVAPAGWSGSLTDPSLTFSTLNYFETAIDSYNGYDASGLLIGEGYANTMAIISQNGSCSVISDCTYAAGAANAYRGGGFSDWYLPSPTESHLMARSETLDFSALHIDTTGTSYWNSWAGNPGAPNAATNTVFTGLGGNNNGYEGGYKSKDSNYLVRPIRAF